MPLIFEEYLVIDPGSSLIKIAHYGRAIGGHTLLRLESFACTDCRSDQEEYAGLLFGFLDEHFPGVSSIILLIPPEDVFIRNLKLPAAADSRIAQILPFEVENLLPVSLDESDVTGHPWLKDGDFSHVISFTATHELLKLNTDIFRDRDIYIKMITIQNVAVAEASQLLPPEDVQNHNIIQIHLGSESTIFNLLINGKLAFSRSIPLGGSQMTQIVSDVLKIPFERADEIKIALDLGLADKKTSVVKLRSLKVTQNQYTKIVKGVSEIFSEIAGEIERTIMSIPDLELNCCYLSGGASEIRGVRELLEETSGIPVKYYPSEILEGSNPSLWIPLLGSAVHYAKNAKNRFDFTRTPFGKNLKVGMLDWNYLKVPGILTGSAFILFLFSFTLGIFFDKLQISRGESEIQKIAARIPGLPKIGNPVSQAMKLCQSRSGLSSSGIRLLDILKDLTEHMASTAGVPFRIVSFQYNTSDIQLEAHLEKLSDVGVIESALKQSSFFTNVEAQSDLLSNKKVKLKVKMKINKSGNSQTAGCG